MSPEQKEKAIELFKIGQSYRRIEEETGVSPAAMTELVREKAEEEPELFLCRTVAVWCQENEKPPELLMRGIAIDEEVEGAGSSMEEVTEKVLPYVKRYGAKAVEHAEHGEAYAKLVEARGWSYEKLVAETDALERRRNGLAAEIEEGKALRGALDEENERREAKLDHVEDLEEIQARLTRVGKRPRDAAKVITESEELLRMGLTYPVMEAVGREFERHGMEAAGAPAVIAGLVKGYGSLREANLTEARKVRSLQRQAETLADRVAQLKETERGFRKSCRNLREAESGLRNDYNSFADRHRRREESMEEELASLRRGTTQWCEVRQTETKDKCDAMVSEAQTRASRIVEAAAQKARRIDGDANLRVEALEERVQELRGQIEGLTSTKDGMADEISASKAIMNYVLRDKPTTFAQIRDLYHEDGMFGERPLPESVRNMLLDAMEGVLSADARARIRQEEERVKEARKTAAVIMSDAQKVKEEKEGEARMLGGRINLYTRFQKVLINTKGAFDSVAKAFLSDPAYLSEALRQANNDYLEEMFARATILDRMRFSNALEAAGRRVDRELDYAIRKSTNDMLLDATRTMIAPVQAFPVMPYSFWSPPGPGTVKMNQKGGKRLGASPGATEQRRMTMNAH